MSFVDDHTIADEAAVLLDQLAEAETLGSNCMFQLALMVARIAIEPCSETYKDEVAQALIGLVRAKPKSNVVRLFGNLARHNRSRELSCATA